MIWLFRRGGEAVWRWKGRLAVGAALLVLASLAALGSWAWNTAAGVDLKSLAEPSFAYATGPRLSAGVSLSAADLVGRVARLGYQEVSHPPTQPGEFRREAGAWEIFLRARDDPSGRRLALRVRLGLEGERIGTVVNAVDGAPLDGIEMEPELLGDLGELTNRLHQPVRLQALPAHLIDAVLAAEDRRFFEHGGIDLKAAVRASWVNMRSGGVVQGASTITQQLVKSLGLSVGRSWDAKLCKLALALAFERRFEKSEILEAYLNAVYFGQHGPAAIYGVGAAARSYFGKRVEALDIGEAAMLAGMIRAPNEYSPIRHLERARTARDAVLQRMRDLALIDEATLARATEGEVGARSSLPRATLGPYFFDSVYAQLEQAREEIGVPRGGLRVFTTLDPVLQRTAEAELAEGLRLLELRFPRVRRSDPAQRLQGALIALDPMTGEIRALVGGRDYPQSQFNRATLARRQPGSTFKPFVYLAALRAGAHGAPPLLTSASVLANDAVTVRLDEESWASKDIRRNFMEQVTPRVALALSLNAPAMQVADTVGFGAVIHAARRLGITSPIAWLPILALGASEVVPLELAAAYAPFANGGRRVSAFALRSIASGEGSALALPRARPDPVIPAEEAFLVTHLLSGVVRHGTGAMARALGVDGPAAGKTGSTKRDAWFVGYTPRLVTLVWVGFDGPDDLGLTGSWGAVPIWARFMRTAMAVAPGGAFPVPPSIVFREVDVISGKLATPFCPIAFEEAFLASAVPTEVCREHGAVVSSAARWLSGLETP